MDQTPQGLSVTYGATPCGAIALTREGLYIHFRCSCHVVSTEILRAYVRSGEKTICLGVLLPENGRLTLDKKLPASAFLDANADEVYIAREPRSAWLPWRGMVEGCEVAEAISRTEQFGRIVAVPYDPHAPLACLRLFRQVTPEWMEGKLYLTMHVPN